MQPHVNLGINYRKHFERIGPSPKKLFEVYRRVRRKLKLHFLGRDISYSIFRDYMKILVKAKRRGFIDESYFVIEKKVKPWWR